MGTCATFNDPLIDEARKLSLGCRGRSDFYRSEHCRTFACAYLSMVVSDVLRRRPAPETKRP